MFIVLFRPFRIGDYIKLEKGDLGIVEDITLRHITINTFENKRLIIPNSVISTESVLNFIIEDLKILSLNDFNISLESDIDQAKKIIVEEIKKLDFVIDNRSPEAIINNEPEFEIRLNEVTDYAYKLRAYVWIIDPLKEFKIKSDLKESVYKSFKKNDVFLPIPFHRVIN